MALIRISREESHWKFCHYLNPRKAPAQDIFALGYFWMRPKSGQLAILAKLRV
jgi:hypothetical protein